MKKQKRKELIDSLFSRYSIKSYEIPIHIFNHLIFTNYRKGKITKPIRYGRANLHYEQPIVLRRENKNSSDSVRMLLIYRPNRNRKHDKEEFVVNPLNVYFPFFSIVDLAENMEWYDVKVRFKKVKIPHKQQLFICMNARPIK